MTTDNHELPQRPPGFDPERTFALIPPCDQALPLEQQRRLIYRFRSVRQWQQYRDEYKRIMASKKDSYIDELVALAMQRCLRGENWRDLEGKPCEFIGEESLAEGLTIAELIQLCRDLPAESTLSEMEKKASSSQQPSPAAPCAASAVGKGGV